MKEICSQRNAVILVALVVAMSISFAIKGQTKGDSTQNIQQIMISATRAPEAKSQAAVSVQIIPQEEIIKLAQINPDITAILGFFVPGMAMQSNTISNRSQTLRGRTPLLLINGIPQSTPLRLSSRDLRSIDPFAIERIEITKGSTSIYGYGAVGGIINIITKENQSDKPVSGLTAVSFITNPFSKKPFKNEGGAGYQFTQQLSGTANRWSYVVNGAVRRSGMLIDGAGDKISPRYGLGEVNTYNLYANAAYRTGSTSRLDFKYNFYRSLQNPSIKAEIGKYLEYPTIGVPGEREGTNEGTPYNHNATLTYSNEQIFANTALDANVYYQNLYTIYDYRNPPRWQTGGQATIQGKKYGLRAQLSSHIQPYSWLSSQLIYGVDALIDRTAQPLVDGRYWVPWLKSTNVAPFLQTKQTIAEDFVWKAGLRYDYIGVQVPNYQTVPDKGDPVDVVGGNLTYNRPTFNTGLVYTRLDAFQPYASFSQGMAIYDLGRVLRSANRDDVSKVTTDPVITNHYEVGFNSYVMQNLEISGSLFRNNSKLGADLIAVDGFWVVERNPQYIWGWEIMADYRLSSTWKFAGSYSMQEGKSDPKQDGSYDTYLSGLLIPPYKLDLRTTFSPNSKLSVSLFYIRTGSRNVFQADEKGVFEEGEGLVRPINLWNLNASYAFSEKLACSLSAENVFNRAYFTQIAMINARNAEYTRGNGTYTTLTLRYSY